MKPALKIFLKVYLKWLAKSALFLHRPMIIAVAGSLNKTFVREAIAVELSQAGYDVRQTKKSYNTEFGLPLSILDLGSGYNSYANWLPAIKQAPKAIFQKMPAILILEVGAWKPGDMKHLLSIIKPKITVISELTKRYMESFQSMENLAEEFQFLVNRTADSGLVILNGDNPRLRDIAQKAACQVELFGFTESDWQALNFNKTGAGISFNLRTKGQEEGEIKLNRFGRQHAYAKLVALAVKTYVDKQGGNQGL